MKLIFDLLGTFGLVNILIAFYLLQKNKLTDDDNIYNLLNLVGSVLVAVYSGYYGAWVSVILNIVWALISIVDMVKNNIEL